jgi:hypothetical protein
VIVMVMDLEEQEWPLLGGYNVEMRIGMGMVEDLDGIGMVLFEDRKGGCDPG